MHLQLSFTCLTFKIKSPGVFAFDDVAWRFFVVHDQPADIFVVCGWDETEDAVIHNLVEITNPSGKEVFGAMAEEVSEKGRALVVQRARFDHSGDGEYSVHVGTEAGIVLQYRIYLETVESIPQPEQPESLQ